MESLLPEAGNAQRAAVILILRGREEVGSTFIGVSRRYAEALQAGADACIGWSRLSAR